MIEQALLWLAVTGGFVVCFIAFGAAALVFWREITGDSDNG